MHHIMLHQRDHLASDAVQLSIHDRKPFQYVWPAGMEKIVARVQSLCQNYKTILLRVYGLSGCAPVISLWSSFKVKNGLHDGLLQILCSNTNL